MQEYKSPFGEYCHNITHTTLTAAERIALETAFETITGVAINKVIDRLGTAAMRKSLSKDGTEWDKGQVDILRQLRTEFNIEVKKQKKKQKEKQNVH